MEKIQHLKNTNDIARLYYSLNLIREVEKRVAQIYPSDKIKSPVHLSIGQEAISVGICEKMKCDDFVVGTYLSSWVTVAVFANDTSVIHDGLIA